MFKLIIFSFINRFTDIIRPFIDFQELIFYINICRFLDSCLMFLRYKIRTMSSEKQNFPRYIYLADDDVDDRELFVDALSEVDSSIILTQAKDGLQLMDILRTIKDPIPEILFLDINMPGKSGFECLEEIRKKEGSLKEVNIIILSTSNDPEDIEKALELGATFYAVKPDRFDVLKSFVKEALEIDKDMIRKTGRFRLI